MSVPTSAAPPERPARASRRPILLAVVAIAAVLGAVTALRAWQFGRTHVSTDNAQVDGHVIPVATRVGGTVARVLVRDDGRVAAGDTVIVLDDAELQARLAQADADLDAARAVAGGGRLDGQSEAQVRAATSQRAALAAQLDAARASQRKAQADLARTQELVAKQIVSRQQLDAAQLAERAASAAVEGAERQLAAATAGVDNAQSGTRLARARLAAAQAVRDNAALQLGYTRIVAPRAGYVSRLQVIEGQLVQAGQPLLTIVDDRDLWIGANFKETQLADLRAGQDATFEIDAYPGCDARGTVTSMSPATGARFALLPPDNATGNFTKVVQRVPVRLAIAAGCGEGRPLRPGMSVTVHVAVR